MAEKIRIGIMGYGNLGRGTELAVIQNDDMQLAAVFTRRNPQEVHIISENIPVLSQEQAFKMKAEIDVMILCGGSATDLDEQAPYFARCFNIVDSFDTHAGIPNHYEAVNKAASEAGTTALISSGWDPGMFSIYRVYSQAALKDGNTYVFWGRGVSQGHSDAVRRISGVLDARQYTVPKEDACASVMRGEKRQFIPRDMHERQCYVVAEEGADIERIRKEIVTMPNYFEQYDTTVHFISQEEMQKEHSGLPHAGRVIRQGTTGVNGETTQIMEYGLTLESNPEFTGSVLTATARAVYRMHSQGKCGCFTILDIPPAYLSSLSEDELRRTML